MDFRNSSSLMSSWMSLSSLFFRSSVRPSTAAVGFASSLASSASSSIA